MSELRFPLLDVGPEFIRKLLIWHSKSQQAVQLAELYNMPCDNRRDASEAVLCNQPQ